MVVAAVLAAAVTASASPSVAARDGQVRVAVRGLDAPAPSVQLRGGIASRGRWFGFVALRDGGGGSWFTVLRAPGYLGVYPVVVRAGGVTHDTGAVVSVVPKGWVKLPVFPSPEDVAESFTRLAPPGAELNSVETWRTGFFTHRDPTYNRLLRVRFTLLGDWRARHLAKGRHELFLSVARLRPAGGWRLLEIVAAP